MLMSRSLTLEDRWFAAASLYLDTPSYLPRFIKNTMKILRDNGWEYDEVADSFCYWNIFKRPAALNGNKAFNVIIFEIMVSESKRSNGEWVPR